MSTRAGLLRYLTYILLAGAVAGAVVAIGVRVPGGLQVATASGTGLAGSWIESIQYLLLVACVTVFGWVALRDRLRRPLAIVLVTFLLLALVRELHAVLDQLVAENFWQVLAALLTVVAGVYEYRHHQRLAAGWERSQPSAGLAIMLAGFILLVPFAQILSQPDLWEASLRPGDSRAAARTFEELAELGAYLLLLIGSLEFLYAWSRLPQTREMERPRRRRRMKPR